MTSCDKLQFYGDEQVTNVPIVARVLPQLAAGLDLD